VPKFILKDHYSFWQTVTVTPPGGEAETFRAHFRYLPEDEEHKAVAAGDQAFFDTVLLDVDDVEVEGGARDARAEVLRHRFIRRALAETYYAGVDGARLGNSVPSATPGPAAPTKRTTT
jgi:hypothetical protein